MKKLLLLIIFLGCLFGENTYKVEKETLENIFFDGYINRFKMECGFIEAESYIYVKKEKYDNSSFDFIRNKTVFFYKFKDSNKINDIYGFPFNMENYYDLIKINYHLDEREKSIRYMNPNNIHLSFFKCVPIDDNTLVLDLTYYDGGRLEISIYIVFSKKEKSIEVYKTRNSFEKRMGNAIQKYKKAFKGKERKNKRVFVSFEKQEKK